MSKRFSRLRFWCVIGTLAVAVQACGAIQVNFVTSTPPSNQVAPASTPTASPSPVQTTAVPTSSSTVAPTATTATTAPVLVTATNGNVFIRRGPDLAFNPVSLLWDGRSERALARDVLGGWVQIPFPDQPDKTGWISVQSQYIVVSGYVTSLPELNPTDWPVPASLLNCSNDQMLIDPGGIVLPSVDNFPENDVSVNPGTYVVRNADGVPGTDCPPRRQGQAAAWACYPIILTVDVTEGSQIIVGTDGQKKSCTVPYETFTPRCSKRPGNKGLVPCPTPP